MTQKPSIGSRIPDSLDEYLKHAARIARENGLILLAMFVDADSHPDGGVELAKRLVGTAEWAATLSPVHVHGGTRSSS